MAVQMLGIKTKFTDDQGRPLVGGSVHTYYAGTSLPQDTFSDPELTVPNTNPVKLDDTGSANIFLKGTYRVRVFDKDGVFVEEQDNVDQLATVAEVFKNKGGLNAANERIDALTSEVNSVKEKTLVVESIADLSTINNPKDGLRVYVKSYHAGLGKGGGYFTYDSSKSDANDEGTVLNGWVRDNMQDQSTNVTWFGAVGNGATDDTLAIQKAIDNTPDGGVLDFPSGTYLVKKNTSLANYPNNDQPCLEVRDRNNITLTGSAELIVKEHAQSILEIQDSTGVRVEGISFKGAGNFPPISGTSGRAEKGTSTGGYHSSGFWGYKKNNSHDSSQETRGGYPNGFPREDGSTGETWGVWNGGFIGNQGYGILIVRSDNITVSKCTSRYFNGAGFQVGFLQEVLDEVITPSKNITFDGCVITDNYSAGICMAYNISGVNITNCTIERTGHPDANPSHDYVDPGYGTAVQWDNVSGVNITSNIFNDNKRKGVDYHSGIDTIVSNNVIKGSYICGIFFTHTGERTINGYVVTGNYILMNDVDVLNPANLGGIFMQTPLGETPYDTRTLISNNTVVAQKALVIRGASGVTVSNNRLISSVDDSIQYTFNIGRPDFASADITVTGNVINGLTYFGLLEGTLITNNRFIKHTKGVSAEGNFLGKDSIVSNNSFGGTKGIVGDIDYGNFTEQSEVIKPLNRSNSPLDTCLVRFNLSGNSEWDAEVLKGSNKVTGGTIAGGGEFVMQLKNFTGHNNQFFPSAYYVGDHPYTVVITRVQDNQVRAKLYDSTGTNIHFSEPESVGQVYIRLDT